MGFDISYHPIGIEQMNAWYSVFVKALKYAKEHSIGLLETSECGET